MKCKELITLSLKFIKSLLHFLRYWLYIICLQAESNCWSYCPYVIKRNVFRNKLKAFILMEVFFFDCLLSVQCQQKIITLYHSNLLQAFCCYFSMIDKVKVETEALFRFLEPNEWMERLKILLDWIHIRLDLKAMFHLYRPAVANLIHLEGQI
jgi:hypothetical protein